MPSETPNLDFIVSRPQAYFQSEKSRRSEIQAMARSELATLRERVRQARNAALDDAAKAAWDAINNAQPDGSWHDPQEIVNTAILALKGS